MGLTEEAKMKLKEKYRQEEFERIGAEIKNNVDFDSISDKDLKAIISLNNEELIKLERENPQDIDKMRRLFIANVNFYKLAKERNLSVHGISIIAPIASVVGYDVKRLYSELTTGGYSSLFEQKGPTTSELINREYETRGVRK